MKPTYPPIRVLRHRWEKVILCTATALALTMPFPTIASSMGNFTRDLVIGTRGEDVRVLQQELFALGYLGAVPTGYFGNMTRIALARWQKNTGIAPALGYFGPKSRIRLISDITKPIAVPKNSDPAPTTTINIPTADLRVALSPENSQTGVLISNADVAASRVPVLGVTFANGTGGDITLQEIKFHKAGTLSDNSIACAYLIQGDEIVTPWTSMNDGAMRFDGLSIVIPAGQTQTLWLAIDPAVGIDPENTASFSLVSVADIIATRTDGGTATISGVFPVNGNIFQTTSVSNPSLASLTVSAIPIGTDIVPPALNQLVASWDFNVQNDAALMKGLKLTQEGGADAAAIQNLKLFVNGTQVATTVPELEDSGEIYFNTSDMSVVLRAGANNVEVYADVIGSPTDDVQFEIFDPYDIFAVDSQYGAPIHGQVDEGTDIDIEGAGLIVNAAR